MNKPGARPGVGALVGFAREHAELVVRITEAQEDYRSMAGGHAGLGGWNISMGNRFAGLADMFLGCPPENQGQGQGQEQKAPGAQGVEHAG